MAYVVASICEEFPALSPTAALDELAKTPDGWLNEIIEARQYARAKGLFDAADTPDAVKRLPHTDMMALAKTITFELLREERERKTRDG